MGYTYDFRHRVAAVQLEDRGDVWVVYGSYNELKGALSALKSQGWRWDPSEKMWIIPKSKMTPRKLTNLKKKLGLSDAADRGQPDTASWSKVVRALTPFITTKNSQGFFVPSTGVDLRPYNVQLYDGKWFLTPNVDSKGLLKKIPAILKDYKAMAEVGKELKRIPFDKDLALSLGISSVLLKGPATYHIKDELKRLGFRYNPMKGWSASLIQLDGKVNALEDLIQSALTVEAEKDAEKVRVREERSKSRSETPATPKQRALLTKLIRRHRQDWFDITDGIGDTRPPTPEQVDNMSKEMASTYISLILEWEQ